MPFGVLVHDTMSNESGAENHKYQLDACRYSQWRQGPVMQKKAAQRRLPTSE